MSLRYPTVFIDRDGVINVNRVDHVTSWETFEFLPGALDALRLLTRAGARLVVITNQAIINRGVIREATLDDIHRRMVAQIELAGGRIDAIEVCPHRPDEQCLCRKPNPGLLLRASHTFGLDLRQAVFIGDHHNDLEAAHRAGCRSILVLSGRVTDRPADGLPPGCLGVTLNLLSAAHILVGEPAFRLAENLPTGIDRARSLTASQA